MTLPTKNDLTILIGHPAYQIKSAFDVFETGAKTIEATDYAEFAAQVPSADVVVASGFWKNELLANIGNVKFIQSIGAGTNQFDRDALADKGIRLASAQGVNKNAVSDHALSLILAQTRRLPEARDNQHKKFWRPMIADLDEREDELAGKTLIVVGLGTIGDRVAKLAKAFDMHVIGIRRNKVSETGHADEVYSFTDLHSHLPKADFVVLNCPLTDETTNIIDETALSLMKNTAYLINTARGACVEESALIAALESGGIRGASIDTTVEEPLADDSPLWEMPSVFITPHTGGETRRYEQNVAQILKTNLERLWAGETELLNQIV